MAVPKKRTSVSRKGKRRGGHTHKLHVAATSACNNCGAVTLPHRACGSCGFYKGKQVIVMKQKKEETESEA